MATVFHKGSGFSAEYASTDFPTLTSDWTGSVSIYAAYPGTAVDTWTLTRVGDVMTLAIPPEDILNLNDGVYTLVATIANTVLGISISTVDYVTVVPVSAVGADMTTITMTIAKIDGTPTGEATKTLSNTTAGVTVVNGWRGVRVTATINDAYNIGTDIIGTETITTETNAAGYAQLAVIKGSTVTVTCPPFGKAVTVDTTGIDTIDLSTFF